MESARRSARRSVRCLPNGKAGKRSLARAAMHSAAGTFARSGNTFHALGPRFGSGRRKDDHGRQSADGCCFGPVALPYSRDFAEKLSAPQARLHKPLNCLVTPTGLEPVFSP